MKKVLLVAVLAAALLVPTASASRSHRVKLAVVVLPKSALGKAGRSLALSRDSGVVSNADASSRAISAKPDTFKKLGRITGYGLVYGDAYSGGSGVTGISTEVDQYKTAAGARRGLAFSRKDEPKVTVLESYGLVFTVKALKLPRVGTRHFAYGTTFSIPNAAPVSVVDEQFADGRYVLQTDVAAGSLSAASHLAATLARKLDRRLRLAEAGHLRGKPVKLPPQPKPGPPPGGPDLATLALTSSDLGGPATIIDHGYGTPSSPELSDYELDMQPAGSFDDLTQIIDWFPTANDATVIGRFTGVGVAYVFSQELFPGTSGQFTPVDLSAVGDNAFGGIISITPPGQSTVYLAVISLSAGQAADLLLVDSQSQIQSADVVDLAQRAANRLNAGLSG